MEEFEKKLESLKEKLKQKLEEKGKTWKAEITEFSNFSKEELHKLAGHILDDDDKSSIEQKIGISKVNYKAYLSKMDAGSSISYPTKIDWRDNNGNYLTKPKQQGKNVPTCVAFATVATVEAKARILKNLPLGQADSSSLPELSEAQLFSCGGGNYNRGWKIEPALEYFIQSGVAPESCFPYKPQEQSCDELCSDWESKVTRVGKYTSINDTEAMKASIATYGPVITNMILYEDIIHYTGGVYIPTTNEVLGGHAICCVGYDDDQDAWICKNSWGPNWGEEGFFLIGYGECGIDSEMWSVDSLKIIYQTS